MRRPRLVPAALASLALTAGVVLVASAGSPAAPTRSQAFFAKALLADDGTSAAVKRLLDGGGGFVAPGIAFTDITGDGRSDALVLVETGGVAGAVAFYVFSTDGAAADSDLRAVFGSQRLYRASVGTGGDAVTIRTPKFARGDDVCCPSKVTERVYTWSAAAKRLVRRGSREVDGPGTQPGA